MISALAWVTVIILAGFPHFQFLFMVQTARQATLQTLEDRLNQQYQAFLEGETALSPSIDDTLKLYHHVLESKSFPISGRALLGVVATLVLNVVPAIAQLLDLF